VVAETRDGGWDMRCVVVGNDVVGLRGGQDGFGECSQAYSACHDVGGRCAQIAPSWL
jgi:hypothetical protein